MKDNFSQQAAAYAQYRPQYPAELFEYILGFVKKRELAWDCGTGNGQSAKILSDHFQKVFATDISQKQMDNAPKISNISYVVEPAEKTSLKNGTVDLVTVAQAIHWFHFDDFYSELRRVAKPGAVIAVWTYSLMNISPEIDTIIYDYHYNTLKDFWDSERKYVDDGYANIPFPFQKIETPSFHIELDWSLDDLRGYLYTWSALQKFMASSPFNPADDVIDKIRPNWGNSERHKIVFPIHLKLGVIE